MRKKDKKEFNVVRMSPEEMIRIDEPETNQTENHDAEEDPVTEMELLQYRMDVMDAINKAWDQLQGMGENGYVSVEMPMSPYEKRELGIKRLKPEEIDWSDTEFCENHEFTLEELMNAPEPTDTKAMLNRIKASARCLKKSSDRTMRELHDFQEAVDKNGGEIPDINEIAMRALRYQDERSAKKGKTYVMSDIHGQYDEYMEMLKKINFGPDDTLYFLGDAIDRGPDGMKILLDMMFRPNVHAILGNHEAMALDALPVLETVKAIYNGRAKDGTRITPDDVYKVNLWYDNGCKPTVRAFMKLSNADRKRVMNYMKSLPLYREIEVNGEKYILVHGGFKHFSPEKPLEDYSCDDIVWARPTASTEYFDDRTVIVGHTPIFALIGSREKPKASSIFHGDGFIDIDCGCVYGYTLGCLCLDTMEEFYVTNHKTARKGYLY